MAKDGFDFNEFKKWAEDIKVMPEQLDSFLDNFLLQQAEVAVADAKENTPVDTGALKNSYQIGGQELAFRTVIGEDGEEHIPINPKTGKEVYELDPNLTQKATVNDLNDDHSVTISNLMNYASYIEYGHHLKGKKPYPPQHMLTNAVDRVNTAMPTRFTTQLINFLRERGIY